MVTLVAQTPKQVMGQQSVAEGDQVDVKLQLLKAVPLEGKLVTLDAVCCAARSLSRNNGRLLAEYPSVQRVLHEFDRAIALGAAD